ncbi:phage tail sheath C-terminal domain-containing protein [Flavimaricola marinus]|uniref:Phage tail sheath protein n=1 Tax=Flavimaricola marinus TaxID=1819565 RepID=A0A238L9M7_9RHOB|nr:phage tail sheath C-terminal domain-containing protein [Flavimaricola marinus]SMY06273.1 Phage tail sheath protein [Flavimaricola marinus]
MLTNQFPGVHVKEIPSGARPIASISTSNTVFIDTFQRGPVNEAVRLTSWADFQRIFGGLWKESEASYGVLQYFQNGGSVAFVVRTPFVNTGGGALPAGVNKFQEATVTLKAGADDALTAKAVNGGSWGNAIHLGVVHHATDAKLYTLLVREYKGDKVVAEEIYQDLSTDKDADRFPEKVIDGTSAMITATGVDTKRPALTDAAVTTLDALKEQAKSKFTPLATGGDGFVLSSTGFETRARDAILGDAAARTGIYALENIVPDIFNIMCIPVAGLLGETPAKMVYEAAEKFCRDRFAFLIVDPGKGIAHNKIYSDWFSKMGGAVSRNAAGYFPRLDIVDTADGDKQRSLAPSGMVAGMMARIDSSRGVWKTTAGTETRYSGGPPEYKLTDLEQEPLNRLGVNAIRSFPVYGNIIWGGRTLVGADALADEYKYAAVRRTALFIQQSLQRGLKWTVFEGNDEDLWGQIRLNVGAFMQSLHRQGAFQGKAASDAYLVKCDGDTTKQADIDLGIVNILVAFAPLKPAEFVVLNFQQLTKLPE